MHLFKVSISVSISLLLIGCAVVQKPVRTAALEVSLAVYKGCLMLHPEDTQACESARLTYEHEEFQSRETVKAVRNFLD
jgi:hypothetical protein